MLNRGRPDGISLINYANELNDRKWRSQNRATGQPNAMFGKFCTKSFTKIITNYDVSKNHLNLTLGKNIQTRPR